MGKNTREQLLFSKMERRRRSIGIPFIVTVLVIMVGMIAFCCYAKYRPPKHDESAKQGTVEPAEEYLYGTAQTEFGYAVEMAANLYQQQNGDVNIYFTNSISNKVYLRCELIDQKRNKVLYRTGYIEPGEYIESLHNSRVANKQYDITVKIYAYTPETFTSEGTTEISLKLQPW